MNREDALERMPHKGAMLLIERIEAIDATSIFCIASDHRAPDYPLRIAGRLSPASLVELGAQAAAAHASLHGIGDAHIGMVLALSRIELSRIVEIDASERMRIEAKQMQNATDGARYGFRVSLSGNPVVEGEATLQIAAVSSGAVSS